MSESVSDYNALRQDAIILDAIRGGGAVASTLSRRIKEMCDTLYDSQKRINEAKLLHDADEKTAEQMMNIDIELAKNIQRLEARLSIRTYFDNWKSQNMERIWAIGASHKAAISALSNSMVAIPGKDYQICAFEVTQQLWEDVMGSKQKNDYFQVLSQKELSKRITSGNDIEGSNPSRYRSPVFPVENVSWYDCQKFLEKLNALPDVANSGRPYRLPTADEWEYASRAGAKGGFCKLADGRDGSRD